MTDKPIENLDDQQRASRVIASQGKSQLLLNSATDEEISQLAEWCDEHGNLVVDDLPGKFSEWLIEYYASRKSTDVENDEPEA